MVRAKVVLNTRAQRSKLVKKSDMIDVQRLIELSEEFATKMSGDLDGVNTQNSTLDELNDKIVESIKDFMNQSVKQVV